MENIQLQIDSLSPEGWGLAPWQRPEGPVRTICVPNSLPGEKVSCDLFYCRSKKTHGMIGEVRTILEPSPIRREVRCKHFAVCGGCTWQQMPYSEQVVEKEKRLKELYKDLLDDATQFYPIIAAPSEWHYRNKMEFSFSENVKGQKFLGLMMRASRGRVFTIEECHLVHPWMANTLQACYDWWQKSTLKAFYGPKNSGHLRNLTLRESHTTGDRVVILTVSGNPEYAIKRSDLDAFTSVCKEHAGENLTCVLRIQQALKGSQTQFFEMLLSGPDSFKERIDGREYLLSPSSFFQPNSQQAEVIYHKALELAKLQPDMVLYDLYAGIGIFGMLAAARVKEVISIELSADSAYDAKVNRDRLQLTNVRLIQADVAKALEDTSLPKADVVLVDPPRTGLGPKAIGHIVALSPKTIVYVSCNPKTQKIDVEALKSYGYTLEAIQPIDQFPQTVHVENIVILSKICNT